MWFFTKDKPATGTPEQTSTNFSPFDRVPLDQNYSGDAQPTYSGNYPYPTTPTTTVQRAPQPSPAVTYPYAGSGVYNAPTEPISTYQSPVITGSYFSNSILNTPTNNTTASPVYVAPNAVYQYPIQATNRYAATSSPETVKKKDDDGDNINIIQLIGALHGNPQDIMGLLGGGGFGGGGGGAEIPFGTTNITKITECTCGSSRMLDMQDVGGGQLSLVVTPGTQDKMAAMTI